MGSQELAFDDELSVEDAPIGHQIGSFDESPTREVRKHLKNLDFHNFTTTTTSHQVFKIPRKYMKNHHPFITAQRYNSRGSRPIGGKSATT
jgi:hypothetical protein